MADVPPRLAAESDAPHSHASHHRRVPAAVAAVVVLYALLAYIAIPWGWTRYVHRHPALEDVPGLTSTGDGHPGDPINVALIGSERDVKRIMLAAKYYPADRLTFRSCLEIADATVLRHPYDQAPVSNLYYFGRKEDLAFEFPVGDDPRKRHHVRYWKSPRAEPDGRAFWFGQTSFDSRVGVSHTTGQITHHIAPDVDVERDFLFAQLGRSGDLASREVIHGFHKILGGLNGGGDPWHTDGDLYIGVIRPE